MPKYTHYYSCKCMARKGSSDYVKEESDSSDPKYKDKMHSALQREIQRQKETAEEIQRQKEAAEKATKAATRKKASDEDDDDDKAGVGKKKEEKVEPSCVEYLTFVRTEEKEGTSSKIIKEAGVAKQEPEKKGVPRTAEKPNMNVEAGKDLVQKRAGNVDKKKASTVAVMWEPDIGTWYQGSSSHPLPKGGTEIPNRIKRYIQGLQVDNADWAFGWNCAEVQCIANAYKKGKTDPGGDAPLKGCYFIAASVGNAKRPYGPCKTCRDWIKHFGGSFFMPQD